MVSPIRLALLACFAVVNGSAALSVLPAYLRPDALGGIVAPDRPVSVRAAAHDIVLVAARGSHASCHLVVQLVKPGVYELAVSSLVASRLKLSLYREWFHFIPAENRYYPDALVPIEVPHRAQMPDADNRIPGQTAQAFWWDAWIPQDVKPGSYAFTAKVRSDRRMASVRVLVQVLDAVVPSEDALCIDHNSYGTSWIAEQYPNLRNQVGQSFFESGKFYALLHAYHRLFYDHRGVYHQLGYGHAGKVGPEFAPRLEGTGRNKHIADWTAYDRHYGPLLDGSAFATSERGSRPIPFVYLPINPEWPASFEWWGQPGYEREFVNVVSEMERHFRDKGWTGTRFEMFFNHKKRYKGFGWDGDEARFPQDYAYLREYARLLKLALPADTPIKFVVRADVSWTMERQWRELARVINFWVCAGSMFNWFPDAPGQLKSRGDVVWTYGGTPLITEPSSHITVDLLRAWMQGVDGFVRWSTTLPGRDPWFQFEGGAENLVYSGDRFGIAEPLASIRLKLERNALEDIALLNELARHRDPADLRSGVATSYNGSAPAEWWTPRPALANTDPLEWSNMDIDAAMPENAKFGKLLDAAAWDRAHAFILKSTGEWQQ